MTNVYVLDPANFSIVGIIDEYHSLIWTPAYYDIGDFELFLSATDKAFTLLKEGAYLVRDVDVSVVDGVATYKNVMVIKNITVSTDIEDGDYLTVTGRELKYLLHSRIVWKQTVLSGNVELAIQTLVKENATNPSNTNRIIPNLEIGASHGITDTISIQITGEYLDESIVSICKNYYIGWDIYISGGKLIFQTYKGIDRSYGQTIVPYIVFSDSFDNLYNTEYQLSTEGFANCTLIGGEGEGTERVYTTVGDELAGLERFEYFTDAKDLNTKSDEEISEEDYIEMLKERGKEKLSEVSIKEGFSGEVKYEGTFKYGVDFFLGDIVTVISKHGIARNVSILSAIESSDDSGIKLIPQFNI